MVAPVRSLRLGIAAAAVTLLSACGSGAEAGSDGGSPDVTITSPGDGASVGSTFEVAWDTNVDLGEPDTGRHHVHVFVDGESDDYTVVGGDRFTIEGLAPGEHTVNVTLQHADHSSAGAEDEVGVVVGSGSGGEEPSPTEESAPGPGYDY